MSESSEDIHNETLSRWRRFQRAVTWGNLRPIVVGIVLVFGFVRPFVVKPFKIPSGSMEDTLLVAITSSSASSSTASACPAPTLDFSTSTSPREAMCSCSFRLMRRPDTLSNASSRSLATRSRRNGDHSTSTGLRSTMAPIQSARLARVPVTIFPLSSPRTFCPTTSHSRITSCRRRSSIGGIQAASRSGFLRGMSSPWATTEI